MATEKVLKRPVTPEFKRHAGNGLLFWTRMMSGFRIVWPQDCELPTKAILGLFTPNATLLKRAATNRAGMDFHRWRVRYTKVCSKNQELSFRVCWFRRTALNGLAS